MMVVSSSKTRNAHLVFVSPTRGTFCGIDFHDSESSKYWTAGGLLRKFIPEYIYLSKQWVGDASDFRPHLGSK